MPTLQIQKWMQLKGHVCIKLTTQAEQSGDNRIQLCIEWRSYDNVLSTIHNWMDLAKKQFGVRCCRNADRLFRTRGKRDIARDYPARTGNDRNPHAPTYEDLHPQRTRHCEERARVAAWELHTIIYKSDGDA